MAVSVSFQCVAEGKELGSGECYGLTNILND